MTTTVRKGVLLRLRPELLERVDQARGALSRTAWLVDVIERHLGSLEERVVGPTHMFAGTPGYVVRAPRPIRDEDGSALGLTATRREDGVLEIGGGDCPSQVPDVRVGDGGPPDGSDPVPDAADLDEPEGADSGSALDELEDIP